MSDINSSLPVRTENPGDIAAKIVDANTPSQALGVDSGGRLTVKVEDSAGNALASTGGSLHVSDGGGSLTVDASDLDIRDLDFAQDSVDVSGSEVSLDAATLAALENITVSASDLDIRDLTFANDKVDVSGSTIDITATDLDIRDLAAAQDSVSAWLKDEAGNAFSSTNPLPVVAVESEGVEVNDFNTSSNTPANASSNHEYTVTLLKTLQLTQINASASGKAKIEVQIETLAGSGVFNTRFVKFNSTANPNMELVLREPIAVPAGAKVRIIRTNKDNNPQDLYSTISGHEV